MEKAEQKDALNQDDHVQRVRRISRVSRVMKWILTAFMAVVVIVGILVLVLLSVPEWLEAAKETIEFGDSERLYGEIPIIQRIFMAGFYEFTIGAFVMTLWYMRRVFASFQIRDYFSSRVFSSIANCGFWFVIFGVMDFLEEPVSSFLTTIDLPEGERELAIGFEGGELFFIIFGMLFITLGWVLREAASIHEENQQFI